MSASHIITTPSISPENIRQLLFSSFSIRSYCWAHLAQLSSDKAVEIVELILNYCPKRCKIFSKLYDEHGRQVLTLSFAYIYFFFMFPYIACSWKFMYLFILSCFCRYLHTPFTFNLSLYLSLSLSLSLCLSFPLYLFLPLTAFILTLLSLLSIIGCRYCQSEMQIGDPAEALVTSEIRGNCITYYCDTSNHCR